MATYIQYFFKTVNPDGLPGFAEVCGSSGTIRVDARLTAENIRQIADDYARKSLKQYDAWQVLRGSALRDAEPFGPIIPINRSHT